MHRRKARRIWVLTGATALALTGVLPHTYCTPWKLA